MGTKVESCRVHVAGLPTYLMVGGLDCLTPKISFCLAHLCLRCCFPFPPSVIQAGAIPLI
jgi:hypothetical protein